MKIEPPKRTLQFLRWFCREDYLEEIEGDLMEVYKKQYESEPRKAKWKFAWSVVRYFRPEFMKSFRNSYQPYSYGMYKSYFKIGWRNLLKSKGYSFINIGGLATGMAVAILISLWVYDEVTFNQSFGNFDRIGQVMIHNGPGTYKNHPIPLAAELRSSFSEDFKHVVMSTQTQEYIISSDDKKFMQMGNYMQADAPELLKLEMIAGTWEGLKTTHSILLTESLSNKLFGTSEAVGKIVKIDNELSVEVAGVFRDFPNNSEFNAVTFIAPWDLLISSYDYIKDHENDWSGNFVNIFVQISPNSDFNFISERIKDIKLKFIPKENIPDKPEVFLHPMNQWHLNSTFENRAQVTSEQLKFVWFISSIGGFILLLASINFMNLSTARSEKRAKEVGLRKTMGSVQSQLIYQFFSESFLTVGIASVIALLIVQLGLPWFNDIAGKEIGMLWANESFWLLCISFILVTGLLSGSYPAFYLSSFSPVNVLKGTLKLNHGAVTTRKILVTVQFSVSILLSIGTVIVYQQLQFVRDRPVGYSRDGLVMIRKTSPEFQGKSDVLSTELKNSGAVSEVAESASTVTSIWGFNAGFDWEGKDPDLQENFGTVSVSHDYGKTVGWQFVEGRDFQRNISSDSLGFIVNETAVRYMGLKNPVGKAVKWDTEFFDGGEFTIIGVVKDMVMSSPFEPAKPMIFFLQGYKGWILVKTNPDINTSEALSSIESVFRRVVPSAPFDYRFANDAYAAKFKTEERIGKLALVLTVLAIVISCLGIFGLAAFSAEQRTKEIGIRKVMGASVTHLCQMLSKDFVILVIIACFIAIPVGYYFMNGWLLKYEYRTEISGWILVITAFGALTLTLLTVSFLAIKAALMNPVKSLRSE